MFSKFWNNSVAVFAKIYKKQVLKIVLVYCTVFVFMNIVQNGIGKTTLFISDVFSHFLHTACGYTKIHFFMIKILEQLKEKQLPLPFFFRQHGEKYSFPPVRWQSQPRQQHLLPWQCFEECGFSHSLLLSFPGGNVTQWSGSVDISSHPLAVSLHHIPEEYCGCRCHHDLHIPFQGLVFHRLFVSILMFFLIVLISKKWLWAWVVNIIKQTNLLLVSQNHEFWTTKKSSKKWLVLNCKPLMNKHLLTLKIRFLIREFPVREN